MHKCILAFDVGGSEIKYAVVDSQGNIHFQKKIPTPESGNDIISFICDCKTKLKQDFNLTGVSFSMPGFVDPEKGYLKTAGAIKDFYGMNFIQTIQNELQLAVEVENDVNCVALAERWLGCAKNCQNFLCLTLGTGVGGAIVLNDELVHGHGYMAGEFGYMLTRNCFEQPEKPSTLSFTGSVREAIRRPYFEQKELNDFSGLSGEMVFDAAQKGDKQAINIINCFYQNIAIGIYNLAFIFNPEKIIIGGAISVREDLIENIVKYIAKIIKADTTLSCFTPYDLTSIEKASLGNNAGIIGATYHFIKMQTKRMK